MRITLLCAALLLSGCSTERQLLELRRDRLLMLEMNATQVRDAIPQGTYDPERYDLYLALDADVFHRVFAEVAGTTMELEAGGRDFTVSLDDLNMAFHPGSPEISLSAKAIDQQTGIEAALSIDTRLLIEGDPTAPDQMTARLVATRIVPDLRWGVLHLTRWRVARALLTLEASKLTEKMPVMRLPMAKEFSFGSSARTIRTERIPMGGDAWMEGDLTVPDTRTSGRFVINNILFLDNGAHIFASVEGI